MWQRDRLARVVREDLRDLERVREVSLVEQLVDLLPERVGAPLSVANLSHDLEVDHKTVDRWLTILENMYVCFRLPPFGSPRIRAVKKEKKIYLWDWSAVADPGSRFENLVACQLLKYCHWVEDTEGFRMELRYLRDTDRREIDFVVLREWATAVRRRMQVWRARHQCGRALLRRAHADPEVLPGPPRRASLRVRQGDGAPVYHLLHGTQSAVNGAAAQGWPERRPEFRT